MLHPKSPLGDAVAERYDECRAVYKQVAPPLRPYYDCLLESTLGLMF